MNDNLFDPELMARVEGLLNQDDIRSCIRSIVAARARLREIGLLSRETPYEDETRHRLNASFDEFLHEINKGVEELRGALSRREFDLSERQVIHEDVHRDDWSLGTEEVRGSPIPFLRGQLEPVRRVVVAPNLPEPVVILFLSIAGLKDHLVRERHGHWGYHYHYLDRRMRRSDTLLTFERTPLKLSDGQQVRVLTWERHSENNHFSARAASWGDKKRESVYEACIGDSGKRALADFKKPAKDAEPVWPI